MELKRNEENEVVPSSIPNPENSRRRQARRNPQARRQRGTRQAARSLGPRRQGRRNHQARRQRGTRQAVRSLGRRRQEERNLIAEQSTPPPDDNSHFNNLNIENHVELPNEPLEPEIDNSEEDQTQ